MFGIQRKVFWKSNCNPIEKPCYNEDILPFEFVCVCVCIFIYTEINIFYILQNWIHIVTESGVWLLTAQKPIKGPDWWKGKLAICWMLATEEEAELMSKGWLLLPLDNQWTRAFIDKGRGLPAEIEQSSLTVILNCHVVVWPAPSWLF